MPLSNLESEQGLQTLNTFVSTRSYIEGHVASQADVAVYEALKNKSPPADKFPHAARWYKHIQSYANEFASLPGTKKDISAYGPPATTTTTTTTTITTTTTTSDTSNKKAEVDDLFASDSEVDEEAERLKAQRLAEYHAKKAAKPGPIAKSSVLLDIKPWDDTTDMAEMERTVRGIEMDGLLWGASKLIPIGYGIRKLQMSLVIEDDKVSIDDLQEKIQSFEELVQSTDITSFNKI